MKTHLKKITAWIVTAAMLMVLVPMMAVPALAQSYYEIDWSGPCDTENTHTIDLFEYLPEGTEVTGVSVPVSALLSSVTPTYSVNMATLKFTTKIFDEPASDSVAFVLSTENGDITFTLNITLTGKYIVNISGVAAQDGIYNGSSHAGYSGTPVGTLTSGAAYTGEYTYTYAKADGTSLTEAPTEIGSYTVTIAVPDDNTEYKGSKTLGFDIIKDVEASYQTEANGEWISGAFTEALSNVYEGGTVKLLKDTVLTETVTVAKKVTITSDDANSPKKITSTTNQHGYLLRLSADVTMENVIVDGGSADNITASRAMIAVGDGTNSGTLTLGNGAVVRNNNNTTTNGAGGGICVITGSLIVNGGEITGNTANSGGGVAMMSASGSVTLSSGKISSNTATKAMFSGGGGAIYISAGVVTMTGGEMKENTAPTGGAVYIGSNNGSFKLSDGTISDNSASYGGAICSMGAKLLEFTGGTVSSNNATYDGGGVYAPPASSGTYVLAISESAKITGNSAANDADNLYVIFPITIGELKADADVKLYARPANFLNKEVGTPASDYTITADDVAKLSFEDSAYELVLSEGNVILAEASNDPVIAKKIDVADIDTATINKDAVGYYVEEMQIDDTADTYKWVITMSDETQYQSETNLPTLSGTGKVSFGIVLYGTVGNYTTSDISTVAVTQ